MMLALISAFLSRGDAYLCTGLRAPAIDVLFLAREKQEEADLMLSLVYGGLAGGTGGKSGQTLSLAVSPQSLSGAFDLRRACQGTGIYCGVETEAGVESVVLRVCVYVCVCVCVCVKEREGPLVDSASSPLPSSQISARAWSP